MLLSLSSSQASPKVVGGKAASLAKLSSSPQLASHVPKSFALTVEFFHPWIETLQGSYASDSFGEPACSRLQSQCRTLPLSPEQKFALDAISKEMPTFGGQGSKTAGLAAVRSSAPEEDGMQHSFAGVFETKLGVTTSTLEQAVRDCFASRFAFRVMSYVQNKTNGSVDETTANALDVSFAVVVMEMINSEIAGVAFSANPLNSDLDKLVLDSSFGLGESVVDGSVTADRYVYDKIEQKIIAKTIGKKTEEKRLGLDGGIETVNIDTNKQNQSSLTEEQLHELAELVCAVEKEYGMPMDVEWAYTKSKEDALRLKLLQARPITTLFCIDEGMLTQPGEKRALYYDYNVVSDCTTTTPFTRMDMDFYAWTSSAMMGFTDGDIFSDDPNMPIFKASTRQYCNLSIFLKYMSTELCAKESEVLDPHLTSLFASKDCDREKYKMKRLPDGVNFTNFWKLARKIPLGKLYKIGTESKKDPEKAAMQYREVVNEDLAKFKELKERGPKLEEGLQAYAKELFQAMSSSFELELGILFFVVLTLFKDLDKTRREGKTEELRSESDALCGGYEGDGILEINVAIHRLASLLPEDIWKEYSHSDLGKLVTRIQGGALQHGALCAREYGKPAVSNIDVHSLLKTGMMVTVDGNTGVVKVIGTELPV